MTAFSAPGVVWKDVRPSLLTRPAIERNKSIHFGGARADRSDGTEVRQSASSSSANLRRVLAAPRGPYTATKPVCPGAALVYSFVCSRSDGLYDSMDSTKPAVYTCVRSVCQLAKSIGL